jgi:cardiolipin synthase
MFLKRPSIANILLAAVFLFCLVSSAAQPSASLGEFSEMTGCPLPVEGNKVQVIDDPGVFYDEMLESIRDAKAFVFMEYYIFRDDSISTVILDALAEKAREGVRTCLILDHYGCAQHMEEKGNRLKMKPFRRGYLQTYLDSGVDVVFYNQGVLFPRNHRKLTLVDGKVAFTGGMNVTDLYLNGIEGVGKFWDMHLKIEGPAVQSFNTGFVRMWNSCGDRPLAVSFPDAPASCGDVPLIILETQGSDIHPNPEELYAALFAMAQHSIRLISGYFTPTRAIVNSLLDAAQRGVDVQMLMGASSDMPPILDKVLMRRAILLSQEENFTLCLQPGGFHHEKAVSIDGHLILIGSHNLDKLSLKTNHEMSVLMDSPAVAGAFDAYFDAHAHPDT